MQVTETGPFSLFCVQSGRQPGQGALSVSSLGEKYHVMTTDGGGEYATQIGFGWTNGVLLALGALYPDLRAAAAVATPDPQTATAALQ